MTFKEYVQALYQDIPMNLCIGLLLVLCLGVVTIIGFYGWKRGWRKIGGLLLVEYIFMLLCSTVVFRATAEVRKYDWEPFWSYKAIEEGRAELLPENIMNVVVFVPVGLLLASAFRYIKWWQVLGIGCLMSMSIEILQFVLKRGFAETDDVMHNTLGCVLGYMLVKGSRCMVKGFRRRIEAL